MAIRAAIFIPTYKNPLALDSCLKSLRNQSVKKFEIIIVGAKGNKNINNIITKFSDLRINYFIQKTKGLVGAANEALDKTRRDYFIRIDDDVVVHKEWFRNILVTYKKFANAGAVTGPTLISEKGFQFRDTLSFYQLIRNRQKSIKGYIARFYYSYLSENQLFEVGRFLRSGVFTVGANFPDSTKIKNEKLVDNFEACNFACDTALLKRVSGFDKVYENGLGEYHEADAAFKIKKLGYKIIFSPKIKVWHKVESSSNSSRPDAFSRIHNFIIFYRKHLSNKNKSSQIRFLYNLAFQDLYYFSKFLTTGDVSQLGAIPGTIYGLIRNI